MRFILNPLAFLLLLVYAVPLTLSAQETAKPKVDELVFAQGYGGEINDVHAISLDRQRRFKVLHSFHGIPKAFLRMFGGGRNRATYLSAGDVTGDGTEEIVVTFGPITENCTYPNIVYVRDPRTARILGHPFQAFPSANPDTVIHYPFGELRTAVGDFIRSGQKQIAIAQGYGGKGYVRLFQYTGQPAPYGWKLVGQFLGLSDDGNRAYTGNQNGGVTLAAGDLDGDGIDELVVGQTPSETSLSFFQVLDLEETRGQGVAHVARRTEGVAFPGLFQVMGGIELTVVDLDGNGSKEIVAASMGNLRNHRDWRDFISTGIVAVLCPTVEDGTVTGFLRPKHNPIMSVLNLTTGALHITSGEFDGNDNGEEIAVSFGCLYTYRNQTVTPISPPPDAFFKIYRIDLQNNDGSPRVYSFPSIDGRYYMQEPNWGQPAYLGPLIPIGGSASIVAMDYE